MSRLSTDQVTLAHVSPTIHEETDTFTASVDVTPKRICLLSANTIKAGAQMCLWPLRSRQSCMCVFDSDEFIIVAEDDGENVLGKQKKTLLRVSGY